jgi:hypothetical protein
MWDIEDDTVRRRGWSVIPDNLKLLYIAMWGKRSFMRDIA